MLTSTIVVAERDKQGSYYYYKTKNEREMKYLFGALSLAMRDGLQIVSVSDINGYKEYEPYTEIKTIAELFLLVGGKALNKV